MPTQPEERRQLAALMEKRRLELGLRWQDVADAGGVALRTLNSARTGDREIRSLSRRGIEKGLRWEFGSIERILSGGNPVPRDGGRRDPVPTPADDALDALDGIMKNEDLPLGMRRDFADLARKWRAAIEAARETA